MKALQSRASDEPENPPGGGLRQGAGVAGGWEAGARRGEVTAGVFERLVAHLRDGRRPTKWSLKTQGISEKRQKVSANGKIYPIRVVKILPPPPPSPESGCDKGMIESKEKVTFQKQLLKSSANVRGLAPRWWWVKGSSGSARTHGRLSPQLHQHAGAQRPTADPLPAHVGEDPASSHGTLCDGTPATPRRPKGLGGGDCSGPWGWR